MQKQQEHIKKNRVFQASFFQVLVADVSFKRVHLNHLSDALQPFGWHVFFFGAASISPLMAKASNSAIQSWAHLVSRGLAEMGMEERKENGEDLHSLSQWTLKKKV